MGPNTGVNPSSSKFVFDFSGFNDPGLNSIFTNAALPVIDSLNNKNWQTILDTNYSLLTNQANVLGYFGVIGDVSSYILNNDWAEGSISYLGIVLLLQPIIQIIILRIRLF